jgi:predicted nuclease of predicted toxin-antitoxin system
MKLLLDENLHKSIKQLLAEYDVFTVQEMGWASKKNGELLRLMIKNGFDVLITADKNLRHQQNFQQHNVSVILLSVKSLALENLYLSFQNSKKFYKGNLNLVLSWLSNLQ